jgi:hypothetical protein
MEIGLSRGVAPPFAGEWLESAEIRAQFRRPNRVRQRPGERQC